MLNHIFNGMPKRYKKSCVLDIHLPWWLNKYVLRFDLLFWKIGEDFALSLLHHYM